MAPEFYEDLAAHMSWTRLLFKFLFDPKLSLYSRMTRTSAAGDGPEPWGSDAAVATEGATAV